MRRNNVNGYRYGYIWVLIFELNKNNYNQLTIKKINDFHFLGENIH